MISLSLPKRTVEYPGFKTRMLKGTLVFSVLGCIILAVLYPALLLPYTLGALLGLGYLYSLFISSEHPVKGVSFVFSIMRIAFVSFLIALLGQFKLLDTCIVFSGFLSYKIVLVLETLRIVLGIKLNSGK